MNDFIEFSAQLLEESKRFLEKAKEEKKTDGQTAYRHSCLLLSMCALEAYINGIADEITYAKNFPLQIKSILLEKELKLERGEFVLINSLKMSKLKDKIEILYRRFNHKGLSESEEWWVILQQGIDLRNKITHPKDTVSITNDFLEKLMQAILDCLNVLFLAAYKHKFPKRNLSLKSVLDF